MAVVRVIEIENFRGVKALTWLPREGINCLIGPGDSGKSTVLEAIDLCLGARRSLQLSDADFLDLDVGNPIRISVTLGALADDLKRLESYGLYLRGFNAAAGEIAEEPEAGLETVMTVQLLVDSDLEPQWTLVSNRAAAQGLSRSLAWGDRLSVAPNWLGTVNDSNLTWRRGSILNRLADERADTSKALAKAAREMRAAFDAQDNEQLAATLEIVAKVARSLGIPVGEEVQALLDAGSVSFAGGTISLHDETGVPLRELGLGSTRLLIAGLQREAAARASIVLIDELEHGLEPHRIMMLLGALGAKEQPSPLQVFMTSHSPVVVRELSAGQLVVLRAIEDRHTALAVGGVGDVQGTIRKYPEALLATTVVVCEGASEVGLLRGLDQLRIAQGKAPIAACGCALVDGGGAELFSRALAFRTLGYRVATLRDSDVNPNPIQEAEFVRLGGQTFQWRDRRALEDELFLSVSQPAALALLDLAIAVKEASLIDEHIKTASRNAVDLARVKAEFSGKLSEASRALLGKAARFKGNSGWFKSVTVMERAAREVIGPDFPTAADSAIANFIDTVFQWVEDGGR